MKKILLGLIILFVLVQLIPVNLPEPVSDNPNDLLTTEKVPDEVAEILKRSCYDCHSNEINYPWYAHIVPVSFLIKRDVDEGREELNFSEWKQLKKSKKAKLLDEIAEEVQEGEMPMGIYTLIHRKAQLNEKEKELIVGWTEDYAESLFSE